MPRVPIRLLQTIATILLLVAAQVSLLPILPWGWSQVDLLVVAVIYRTIRYGWQATLPYAVAAGFLYDLFAPSVFGVQALRLVAAAVAVGLLGQWVVTNRTWPAYLTLALAGSLIADAASGGISWATAFGSSTPWSRAPLPPRWLAYAGLRWLGQLGGLMLVLIFHRRVVWDAAASAFPR